MFKRSVLAVLAAIMIMATPVAAAEPALDWAGPHLIAPDTIADIDCPTTTFCIAVDVEGNAMTTSNPSGDETAWQAIDVTPVSLRAVSCALPALCVAVGTKGELATSTDPTGGAAAWTTTDIPGASYLGAVDCAPGVCVALDNEGRILLSSNPTGGAGAWTVMETIGTNQFFLAAIDCPSANLCVATGSEYRNLGSGLYVQENIVFTISDPVGPGRAFKKTYLGPRSFIRAISCTTTTFCVAIDKLGEAWTSTDPTGGAPAWTNQLIDTEGDLNDISCPTTTFCAAVDDHFQALTSTNPLRGLEAWAATSHNTMTNISCPSASLCISAKDNYVMVGMPPGPPKVITIIEGPPPPPPPSPTPGTLFLPPGTVPVKNGQAKLRLTCTGTSPCEGSAKLRARSGRLLASKRFWLPSARTKIISVPLRKFARRAMDLRKSLPVKVQIKAQVSGQPFTLNRMTKLKKKS